jgi:hypothetical protein
MEWPSAVIEAIKADRQFDAVERDEVHAARLLQRQATG